MKHIKKAAYILALVVAIAVIPLASFAEAEAESTASAEGRAEFVFSAGIDSGEIENKEPEEMFENFLLSDDSSSGGSMSPSAPLSWKKGDRLSGNNSFFYKTFRSLIKKIAAGKRSTSAVSLSMTKITGSGNSPQRSLA